LSPADAHSGRPDRKGTGWDSGLPMETRIPACPGRRALCNLPFTKEIELTQGAPGSTIKIGIFGLLPLLLLAMAGCRRDEFVPDAKFVDLYVELKLATVGHAADMEKVNEVRRVILAQHKVTPAEFHAETGKLLAHPKAWRKFQEDVVAKAEALQSSHKEKQEN
jgi:hypothetical protein